MSRLGYINIMFYVISWKQNFTKKLFLYSRKKMSFWTYFNSKKWVYWNSFSFGNLIWKSLNVTRKKSKNKKMLVSNYIKKIKGLATAKKSADSETGFFCGFGGFLRVRIRIPDFFAVSGFGFQFFSLKLIVFCIA